MLPTLWPGDCLTIQSHSFEEVQPGDLVLYVGESYRDSSPGFPDHAWAEAFALTVVHCLVALPLEPFNAGNAAGIRGRGLRVAA